MDSVAGWTFADGLSDWFDPVWAVTDRMRDGCRQRGEEAKVGVALLNKRKKKE